MQNRLGVQKNKYAESFLIALLIACVLFIPYIIFDRGYFIFYGDFNVQQIPFYKMAHQAIRDGNIFWNWTTDLGANFIGSYSFYLLGSPFFWLTLPFPNSFVPHLMGPLLILRFACASLTAYAFIKRFTKNQNHAVIGGLLYAFSGFTVVNVFFNHFLDSIVFFPLLLIALEEFMENDRKGVLALAVCLNCVVNYFFFAGQVVFVFLYWLFRMGHNHWKCDLKKFLLLGFECLLGLMLSAIILFPSLHTVLSNPRTNRSFEGFGHLFYSRTQLYGAIIHSFFFPPELPARPNFFPDMGFKWASLGAWLPLFGMTGVIALFQTKRKNWVKNLIFLLCFMALVPMLNSLFFLLNSSYYARWYYMLVLMMCLGTVLAIDDEKTDWPRALRWSAGITAFFVLTIGFLPKKKDGDAVVIGLMDNKERFWVYTAIAALSLILSWFVYRLLKKDKKKFSAWATVGVAVISMIYGSTFIGMGRGIEGRADLIIDKGVKVTSDMIKLDDIHNVRSDVYGGKDNQAMFWQIPTIQAFHSLVPRSIMDFYNTVGVQRDVGSRPETSHYALRSLLSTRYLFDRYRSSSIPMPGWKIHGIQNGFQIWENEYYIPFGFTYDHYITYDQLDKIQKDKRENALLKALVLDKDQVKRYKNILTPIEDVSNMDFTEEAYKIDCIERRQYTCKTFSRDNMGFTATIDLPRENLVFFSVPWEEGWSVTVTQNGKVVKDAVLEKVSIGFMAVKCPAGESTIRFDYMTPYLIKGKFFGVESFLFGGVFVTSASIVVFVAYLLIARTLDKKSKKRDILSEEGQEEAYLTL